MVSVLLAVTNNTEKASKSLTDFTSRLYLAFYESGCRIVLGTFFGVEIDVDALPLPILQNAFRFPVDLEELDAHHLSHYDLVCVLNGVGDNCHVVCTSKWGEVAGELGKDNATIAEAVAAPYRHGVHIVKRELSPELAEEEMAVLIQEFHGCLSS